MREIFTYRVVCVRSGHTVYHARDYASALGHATYLQFSDMARREYRIEWPDTRLNTGA